MIGLLISAIIFVVAFVAILRERVDRTIIAMAGAGTMLAVGLLLGFYSQELALEAIDFNTLGLLLGMMVLVSMLAATGFFQYLAILTAKRSKGDPWRLLLILGGITTITSMFLDNVTTLVLIAPVSILIAEILGISPVPFLISEALLSNTGGVATLVGDPPNIIIASAANFSFNDFLIRLAPIVAVAWIVAVLLLRYLFRKELSQISREADALGSLEAAAGRFENEPHTDTQAGEHVDERVSAEEVDPAPKQVTHPRLRYTENFGHLGLLEASGRD